MKIPNFKILLALLFTAHCSVNVHAAALRWSDPATWGGNVPVAGQQVMIPAGKQVLLDVETPVLQGLMIRGELSFEDEPGVGLSAHWIMIMGEGASLSIGSETQPYINATHITVYGTDVKENVNGDPIRSSGSKFLMAMDGGTLSLHGISREKTSWTKLTANAEPGDMSIQIADANTGWEVGDRLAIGPGGYYYQEAADVTITAIDGDTIWFTPALTASHWGTLQTYGDSEVDQRTPVGLLSRNIKIQGADDSLLLRSELPYFPGYGDYYNLDLDAPLNFGVHVMIMGGLGDSPTAHAYVEGVEFTRSGQMSLQGRYSFHWHWVGEADGQYFRNNSVHHAFQRAVNVHRTSGVEVSDNVAYRIFNHNYVWAEDGHESEFNNRFRRNLVIMGLKQDQDVHPFAFGDRNYASGTGPVSQKQEEWRSSGFWGRNYPHTLEDNHVAGIQGGMGFFFDVGGGNRDDPHIGHFRFTGNTAQGISDTESGLATNNDLYPPAMVGAGLFILSRNVGPLEFSNFHAFKNKLGVWMEASSHTIRDSLFTDNAGAVMMFQGRVEDSVIVGITENPIGRDFPEVRGRSPRSINTLGALSSGVFIFGGQGGQKTIKATNLKAYNTPGGAIRSSDILSYHGSYFQGLQTDENTLPIRITGVGVGAFLDLDGTFDPTGLGRPTWMTFADPYYISADSVYNSTFDAWLTPETGQIIQFTSEDLLPFGPAASTAQVIEHGLGLQISGDGGVALPIDYEITPDTVLEFHAIDDQIHGKKSWAYVGIGLTSADVDSGDPRLFMVDGRESAPFETYSEEVTQSFRMPDGGVSPPGYGYRIPIGQFYTGPADRLAIYGAASTNADPEAAFRFHLIRVYEKTDNHFRGWPVRRDIYEDITSGSDDLLTLSDLRTDPRHPENPTRSLRVSPYYGTEFIHSYGKKSQHSTFTMRQRKQDAMEEHSYLVVDQSGTYTFKALTEMDCLALDVGKADGTASPAWQTIFMEDETTSSGIRGTREVVGSVYLQAGQVYHWRHTMLTSFAAAPPQHRLLWRIPGAPDFQTFNANHLRPAAGPLAGDEPDPVTSIRNDDVPDWWKLENGIDTHSRDPLWMADGQPAGDGLTNLEKYVYGLNPQLFEMAPIPSFNPVSGMVEFETIPGRRYQLLVSTNLKDWDKLGEPYLSGSGGGLVEWPVGNSETSAFYKVSVDKD